MQAINARASLPADIKAVSKEFNLSYRTLLSVNPKTEKSAVQTYILHLAPADTSGVNVCAGAGNCKKVCLHFAGNPVYMTNKQKARIRRTLAYSANPQRFARLIICAILDKIAKHPGEPLAFRLNGTSDIAYENLDFDILPDFARFCHIKWGVALPLGKRNIFELFNYIMGENEGLKIEFYDYTKIKRNWAECKRLGYHLTFSFDGYSNRANLKLACQAISQGVNIAAAFDIKKGKTLPPTAYLGSRSFKVVDGDLTDHRPSDPQGFRIIGLRFKLPHGIAWSQAEKLAFCLSDRHMGAASTV